MNIFSLILTGLIMVGGAAYAHEPLSPKKAWDCKAFLVAGNKIDNTELVTDPQLVNLVKNLFAGSFDITLASGTFQIPFYEKILNQYFAQFDDSEKTKVSTEDLVTLTAWRSNKVEFQSQESDRLLAALNSIESFPTLSFAKVQIQNEGFAETFKQGSNYISADWISSSMTPARLSLTQGSAVFILKSKTGSFVSGEFEKGQGREDFEILMKPHTRWKVLKSVESRFPEKMPHLVFLEEI